MQRFADRPSSTWRTIELALPPIKPDFAPNVRAVDGAIEKSLDEVVGKFQTSDFIDDRQTLWQSSCWAITASVPHSGPRPNKGRRQWKMNSFTKGRDRCRLYKAKIDFAVVLSVNHANPNGDPLNGNRPRTDYDGFGEITDVCLKRKMRDRLQEHGHAIFVQSNDRRNDDARSLRERAEKVSWQQVRLCRNGTSWPVRNGLTCAPSAKYLPCQETQGKGQG